MTKLEDVDEVHVKPGRRLTVTTGAYVKLPAFDGIGRAFQEIILLKLSKPARDLLLVLIDKRDIDTNESVHVVRDPTIKSITSRAYKELEKYEIAFRVRKQTYLLNPKAVIPRKEEFEKIQEEWKFRHQASSKKTKTHPIIP